MNIIAVFVLLGLEVGNPSGVPMGTEMKTDKLRVIFKSQLDCSSEHFTQHMFLQSVQDV